MTSHDTKYVLNEHINFSQHDPYAISSEMIIVTQLFCKFQESNWSLGWFIASMNSFDTNYILNDNEKHGQ